ncbi:MAG: TIGR01777 family oxidoreductase [Terriglobia bacterium]
MKIVIPGGTGQVGRLLARAFTRDHHEVVTLGRTRKPEAWRVVKWDPCAVTNWAGELDGADVVINLAGRSVNCRYTRANRDEILQSRVHSVKSVGQAIAATKCPPKVWLQASTAAIYAHSLDKEYDEVTGRLGGNETGAPDTWKFSIEVATAWERGLDQATTPHTRKVKLRSAMIMSPDADGIFDTLLGLIRLGVGGTAGSGRQYVSWIHESDFVRAIYRLIENDTFEGAVNLASPNPLPNKEFMAILRQAYGFPFGLPATEWMLSLGALFLRTETELILKSRRVVPGRLLKDGFKFDFPDWESAARELCDRYRANRKHTFQRELKVDQPLS